MSGSDSNASNLHRSKSTSVKDRRKHPLPSQPLDPETSRVHALIAAHRAMDRSKSRSSGDIGRSDSNASRRTAAATTQSQNVRFSPATELRRQRSVLQSKTPHLSAALRVPSDARQDDPYHETAVSNFGAMAENYGSEPSSYRRIRRARSMLTPRRRLFSNPSSPNHTPFSQAPTLRSTASSTALATPGIRLQIKKSLTFLRPASGVSIPRRPETHIRSHDEAVSIARTQFLNDMEGKGVQKRSSFLFLPKVRHPQKAFRKSVRSSQLRDTDDSLTSDTPSAEVSKPQQSKRSFSATLRERVLRAFGRSSSNKPSLPPQQLGATRQHFGEPVDDAVPTSGFDNYLVEQDEERRESFYAPSRPDADPEEDIDRFSPTLHTAASRESLHSNARSRVTSWTNSSMTSSTIRGPGLERNRLSIIKEDGGPHQPSCSAGKHIGGISLFQQPLEDEDEDGQPYAPVDSQRIYSALMKRIGEEEVEIQHTQAALDEIHERRRESCDPFDISRPTIRAVSCTTVDTEATEKTRRKGQDNVQSQQDFSAMTPILHRQNVERRKAKLASQEEQSSFFPFSEQQKPQTPSPFRKLLEQRRSEGQSDETVTYPLPDGARMTGKHSEPASRLAGSRFGMSSESIYSQTTNGGENPYYIPGIASSEDLAPVTQEIDEDSGMATIIPARCRPSERPRLRSADSNEQREWKGWAEGQLGSLGRRDSSKTGNHYREHAQVNPEDVRLGKEETPRPTSKTSAANRFPLLDLKEVPRNNAPAPKRSRSFTKSQSGLLKRASHIGLKSLSGRNDENAKIGNGIRKLSPGNIANMLKEKKSQMLMTKPDDTNKENKPAATSDSPRSSSPPMSTPGRLHLQMRSGNGRLRKRASDMAVRSGARHEVPAKKVSTPLQPKTQEYDESPTDRVKHSLSARLSRPFNMDVPESNRPFDSMFLGKQEINVGAGRLSTAPNALSKRPKGYGGLGPNPLDGEGEDTALPQIPTSTTGKDDTGPADKGRTGWSSKRMVSDFLRKRRLGRSASTDDEDAGTEKQEGQSPAFV